jgi:hypothetical protein
MIRYEMVEKVKGIVIFSISLLVVLILASFALAVSNGTGSSSVVSCDNSIVCEEMDRVWLSLVQSVSELNNGRGATDVYNPSSTSYDANDWDEFCDVYDCGEGDESVSSAYDGFNKDIVGPWSLCESDSSTLSSTYKSRVQKTAWDSSSVISESYYEILVELAVDHDIDPALLALIAEKESGMGNDNSCTSSDSVSALTGCDWPTGTCLDRVGYSDAESDRAQFKCSTLTLLKAYEQGKGLSSSGSYVGCADYKDDDEELWQCLLCVYNTGTASTSCDYVRDLEERYCPWFNYFDDAGVYNEFDASKWEWDPEIESQVDDASGELIDLLTCMRNKLPDGVGRISSISDSAGFDTCVGSSYAKPPCAHTENSAHYGCSEEYGKSLAVDLGDEENTCALAQAAVDCGAYNIYGPVGYATSAGSDYCGISELSTTSGHEDHIHISVKSADGTISCR